MFKVLLRRKISYEVVAADKVIGTFTKDSNWEGMTKLKSGNKHVIIQDPNTLTNLLQEVLGEPQQEEVVVISASPVLADKIQEAFKDRKKS